MASVKSLLYFGTVNTKKEWGLNCCGLYKKDLSETSNDTQYFPPVKMVAQKDGSDVPVVILSSNTETVWGKRYGG